MKCFLVFIQVVWYTVNLCEGAKHKCEQNLIPVFAKCTQANRTSSIFPVSECRRDTKVCTKTFGVSYVEIEPFSSKDFKRLVTEDLLNACCGRCTNTSRRATFSDMTQINSTSINSSDLVFPILGRRTSEMYFGFHFIPILDVPGGFYITEKKSQGQILRGFVSSVSNLWPLLVIMLLLSIIAGALMWGMETWYNEEEFPRPFIVGVLDGFWWSFISMTTVGYGDKVPRFLVSRLFSVLWILFGIALTSMFTASVLTELMRLNSPPTPEIESSQVGILRHRLFDAMIVAKEGGKINETNHSDVISGVREMIEATNKKKINGFFIDKYTYMYVKKMTDVKFTTCENKDVTFHTFFTTQSIHTKVTFDGEPMAYGILLRQKDDADFFREFVVHNQDIFETCKRLEVNSVTDVGDNEESYLFSPDAGYFIPILLWVSGFVVGVFVLGLIYECCRHQIPKRDKSRNENGNSNVRLMKT